METKLMYKPYTGPGGPTKEQTENNTLYLAELLEKEGIKFVEDREYAKELWDGDEIQLKIVNDNGDEVWVGFDRWGYVVDGTEDLEVDQVSPETTVNWIKNWIKI